MKYEHPKRNEQIKFYRIEFSSKSMTSSGGDILESGEEAPSCTGYLVESLGNWVVNPIIIRLANSAFIYFARTYKRSLARCTIWDRNIIVVRLSYCPRASSNGWKLVQCQCVVSPRWIITGKIYLNRFKTLTSLTSKVALQPRLLSQK